MNRKQYLLNCIADGITPEIEPENYEELALMKMCNKGGGGSSNDVIKLYIKSYDFSAISGIYFDEECTNAVSSSNSDELIAKHKEGTDVIIYSTESGKYVKVLQMLKEEGSDGWNVIIGFSHYHLGDFKSACFRAI